MKILNNKLDLFITQRNDFFLNIDHPIHLKFPPLLLGSWIHPWVKRTFSTRQYPRMYKKTHDDLNDRSLQEFIKSEHPQDTETKQKILRYFPKILCKWKCAMLFASSFFDPYGQKSCGLYLGTSFVSKSKGLVKSCAKILLENNRKVFKSLNIAIVHSS